jgi:hypothetical protein
MLCMTSAVCTTWGSERFDGACSASRSTPTNAHRRRGLRGIGTRDVMPGASAGPCTGFGGSIPRACLLQRSTETRIDIRDEQLSRRTTDPLTRRDHLMHTDIQDICENPPSQERALKNTCGYPQINVTSGNRQHDRHNAESNCYTPASRAAAAARPKCRWRRHRRT